MIFQAKGLQKLKFWCELCHKQCRDANGYKMHCATDGHLRQVSLFSQNASAYLDEYSKEFEKNFMELVKRRWRFKDILAKKAYNEYIQDKEHVHMNATRWVTLTDFVHHLSRAGLCEIRDSEEGWIIRYIDRDPEREAKQAMMREREKEELEQRDIERKRLLRVVKAMGETSNSQTENESSALSVDAKDESPTPKPTAPAGPISFSFSIPKVSSSPAPSTSNNSSSLTQSTTSSAGDSNHDIPSDGSNTPNDKKRARSDEEEKLELPEAKKSKLVPDAPQQALVSKLTSQSASSAPVSSLHAASSSSSVPSTSKLAPNLGTTNSLDSLMAEQEKRREREGRKDYWLHPNIVVKILNKSVGGGQFYGQKGVIKAVHETYIGEVRLDSGTVLKIDQEDLETVLPALGGHVMIVNGAYRGDTATLKSLNEQNFSANVSILAGPARGRIVSKAYEDICKVL